MSYFFNFLNRKRERGVKRKIQQSPQPRCINKKHKHYLIKNNRPAPKRAFKQTKERKNKHIHNTPTNIQKPYSIRHNPYISETRF